MMFKLTVKLHFLFIFFKLLSLLHSLLNKTFNSYLQKLQNSLHLHPLREKVFVLQEGTNKGTVVTSLLIRRKIKLVRLRKNHTFALPLKEGD